MSDDINAILMDKIRHSAAILEKESELIGEYAFLRDKIEQGFLMDDRGPKSVYKSESYYVCWRVLHEIYLMLKYNKLKELMAKPDKKIKIKRCEQFCEIMNRHGSFKKKVTLTDLDIVTDIAQEIISASGYHDDTYSKENEEEWGEDDVY